MMHDEGGEAPTLCDMLIRSDGEERGIRCAPEGEIL
jgi:hypothetical protein